MPGLLIGEAEVLASCRRFNEVVLLESGEFAEISAESFVRALDEDHALCRELLDIANGKFLGMLNYSNHMQAGDAREKTAFVMQMLQDLCGRKDGASVRIPFRVSQDSLASLSGITRQSVNRILKDWKEQGILRLDRDGISILAKGRLKEISGDDGIGWPAPFAKILKVMRGGGTGVSTGPTG